MAETHVHKVYGSFPPWGKSVEFPATGGGGGNYVYYSGTTQDFGVALNMASIVKANANGDIVCWPLGGFLLHDVSLENTIGACFDASMKITSFLDSSEWITLGEAIAEFSENWTQITEEEFYKIPRYFTYRGKTYQYEEGQTWGEWVNTSYNTIGARVGVPEGFDREAILKSSTDVIVDSNTGIWIKPSDLIQSNIAYSYSGTMPE